MSKQILIKSPKQIQRITTAWSYLTELLLLIQQSAKSGVALIELEEIAATFLKNNWLTGSFKWYHWFPANLCLSVNDCVVHGIPNTTELQDWDLLKVDAGVTYKSCIADSAISFVVWGDDANPEWARLIAATKEALDGWIKLLAPWKSCYEYAKYVYSYLRDRWFSVIKNLTWHGVWIHVHEWPSIYNRPHDDMHHCILQPWMVVALEPITAVESEGFIEDPYNGWNIYTSKWDLGAQREYTIVVTPAWIEIVAWVTTR